jgi:hypothetical protein
VRGLKFDSVVARMIHAVLSSYTLDGDIVELKALMEIESVHFVGRLIKECATMSCKTRQRGRISLAAVYKAMYSLSVVERAILDCNLLAHEIGQPQEMIT